MANEKIICADCGREITANEAIKYGGAHYCTECVAVCAECGEVAYKRDMREDSRGDWYCEECADDLLRECEECGKVFRYDRGTEVMVSDWGRYEWYCDECVDEMRDAGEIFECGDCGNYYLSSVGIAQEDGNIFACPNCECNYRWCECCDRYVHYTQYNAEEDACVNCAPRSLVKSYHHADKSGWRGKPRVAWGGVMRGVGLELEIDRDDRDGQAEARLTHKLHEMTEGALVFERDGSLERGFEIITKPHTEEAFYALPWRDILTACVEEGYKSHNTSTCGLHLHLSRVLFGESAEKQERAIAKLIKFYDTFYADIVRVSRRGADTAERWARPYNRSRDEVAKMVKGEVWCERYHAVNITNPHTVEIRIMRGTLKYETFMACIDFIIKTAKKARSIKWADVDNAERWLEYIEPSTREYIKSRGASFGGAKI